MREDINFKGVDRESDFWLISIFCDPTLMNALISGYEHFFLELNNRMMIMKASEF